MPVVSEHEFLLAVYKKNLFLAIKIVRVLLMLYNLFLLKATGNMEQGLKFGFPCPIF